jgi:hypothetical protein
MSKEEKKIEEDARTYTFKFEDGETVSRTAEELTGEQIFACEKMADLNVQIQRLNVSLSETVVLRDSYQAVAVVGFKEPEVEDKE